jgi:hypothetical protein
MGIKKKHKKEKSSRRFSDPSSSLSPGSTRFLQDDGLQSLFQISIRFRSSLSSFVPLEGRYEGEIEEGNKHGYGIYYSTNGSVYNGQWEKNHPHGYGKKVQSLPISKTRTKISSLFPQVISMKDTMKVVLEMVGVSICGSVATNTRVTGKVV